MIYTKQLFIKALLSLTIFASCGNQQKIENEFERIQDDFDPPELNINEFIISGNKIVLSKNLLLNEYGKPDTIIHGGAFQPNLYMKNKTVTRKTLIEYESYIFKFMKFGVWNDKAQLTFIDIQNSDIKLKHPLIKLSKQTNISEIEDKFPTAYKWKNYTMNSLFGWNPEEEYGFKKEDCTWVQFKNGVNERYWKIELTFVKDKLIWVYFDIAE